MQVTMVLEVTKMDHKSFLPYPKNSLLPFYVEKDCCITCEAPYQRSEP